MMGVIVMEIMMSAKESAAKKFKKSKFPPFSPLWLFTFFKNYNIIIAPENSGPLSTTYCFPEVLKKKKYREKKKKSVAPHSLTKHDDSSQQFTGYNKVVASDSRRRNFWNIWNFWKVLSWYLVFRYDKRRTHSYTMTSTQSTVPAWGWRRTGTSPWFI